MLSQSEIEKLLKDWNRAWDRHDLDGVMQLFHEDVIFENWTGARPGAKRDCSRPGHPGLKTTAVLDSPRKKPSSMSGSKKYFTAGAWIGLHWKAALREKLKRGAVSTSFILKAVKSSKN